MWTYSILFSVDAETIVYIAHSHSMQHTNVLLWSMSQEEIWVTGPDYRAASADPLRECAKKIVEDMNRNHWEDIRRFCLVYVQLDAEVCPGPW